MRVAGDVCVRSVAAVVVVAADVANCTQTMNGKS